MYNVTLDPRYVEICARMNRLNVKVGKAKDFATRRANYWKEFDEENVIFEPIAGLDDIVEAKRIILRALKDYRKLSPKSGKPEWLERISYEDAKNIVFARLRQRGIAYTPAALDP